MVGAFDRVGAVWHRHALDVAALERHCRATLAGFVGPLEVAQFHGGASNPTYLLTDAGSGKRYVLRKPPPGPLLARAHAIDREYRVMRALQDTAVPVPRMLGFSAHPGVIGTQFFLMSFVEGRIYKDNHLADMTPEDRRQAYRRAAEMLATLHAIDVEAIGLANFGQAEGYLARQLARWTRQYRASETQVIASMDRLIERLPGRLPADERAALIHGDYRQENIMFAPAVPEVVALLDWELSTIGHPVADLAFFCLFYYADFTPWGSAATIDFAATGIPREDEFVGDYCRQAGRDGIDQWRFHLGFAAFRLAAIAQGVQKRMDAGDARVRDHPPNARQWADLAEQLLG